MTAPAPSRPSLLVPYLLAFMAGFQILVVEMVAGRYINLYLGSSLYGWTTLIGVVLGGVSFGNIIGGWLATKPDVRYHLGLACLMSALLILVILRINPILSYAVTDMEGIDWAVRVVLVVGALLFVPSVAMGLISPMAARWALSLAPERPGELLGTMSALGTWGAIMGAFLPGFFLIAWMGTASLLLTLMCLMGLLGLWLLGAPTLRLGPLPAGWLAMGLVVCGMLWVWPLPGREAALRAAQLRWFNPAGAPADVIYVEESDYFTIKVVADQPDAEHRTLQLVLDHLVHGYIVEGEPTQLEYSYEHIYSWVTRRWAHREASRHPDKPVPMRALYLGGGSYTFPRWVEIRFPGAEQLVSEIDPRVTETVYSQMGLPRDTSIRSRTEDARRVVETEIPGSWDLIFGDAFNGFSVPYHLTTLEFTHSVRNLLAPGGVYQLNVIDLYDPLRPERGRFVASMVRTLAAVFGAEHLAVWVDAEIPLTSSGAGRTTYVIVATTDALSLDNLGDPKWDVPPSPGQAMRPMIRLPESALGTWLEVGTLLTDDFCPVDQLLAPVAATRAEIKEE